MFGSSSSTPFTTPSTPGREFPGITVVTTGCGLSKI
jgi:hypothetical protein